MTQSTIKKKKSNKFLYILLGILALLVAFVVYKNKSNPKGTEVEIGTVETRTIRETVSASGRIFPESEVKISSDVSGEVVALYVEEGDSVKAGQILAKIDPEAYISAVERGTASVNTAKSQLATSQAQVENSRAQIEQIKAQLINAKSIHTRNIQLKKEGVISAVEFDQSESNLRSLEANLKSAEAGLSASVKSAEGAAFGVKSAEAGLKELRTSLNRTTISAPTSGIVSSLSVEQGERVVGTIQMTGTEMMRISNLNKMEVQVDVSENDVPRVSIGDEVEIDVDAYLNKKFKGTVTQIANSASDLTGLGASTSLRTDQVTNFSVKIAIDPASYQDLVQKGNKYPFRPGMSASVDIFTNTSENIKTVPIQAVTVREKAGVNKKKEKLTDEDYEEVVFTMVGDTAAQVSVKTGIQDDEYIEITSGLDGSESVITGPYNEVSKKLKSGEKIIEKKKDTKKEKK